MKQRKKQTKPKRPEIELLDLQLTFAKMLERLVEEVAMATPAHAWQNMRQIREDAKAMREELEKTAADFAVFVQTSPRGRRAN